MAQVEYHIPDSLADVVYSAINRAVDDLYESGSKDGDLQGLATLLGIISLREAVIRHYKDFFSLAEEAEVSAQSVTEEMESIPAEEYVGSQFDQFVTSVSTSVLAALNQKKKRVVPATMTEF